MYKAPKRLVLKHLYDPQSRDRHVIVTSSSSYAWLLYKKHDAITNIRTLDLDVYHAGSWYYLHNVVQPMAKCFTKYLRQPTGLYWNYCEYVWIFVNFYNISTNSISCCIWQWNTQLIYLLMLARCWSEKLHCRFFIISGKTILVFFLLCRLQMGEGGMLTLKIAVYGSNVDISFHFHVLTNRQSEKRKAKVKNNKFNKSIYVYTYIIYIYWSIHTFIKTYKAL